MKLITLNQFMWLVWLPFHIWLGSCRFVRRLFNYHITLRCVLYWFIWAEIVVLVNISSISTRAASINSVYISCLSVLGLLIFTRFNRFFASIAKWTSLSLHILRSHINFEWFQLCLFDRRNSLSLFLHQEPLTTHV